MVKTAQEMDLDRELGRLKNELPVALRTELYQMSPQCIKTFAQEYKKKRKKLLWALLAMFLVMGGHYIYLERRWGMWLLFLITGGGLGIWAIYDLIKLPSKVRNINEEIALEIMSKLKALDVCKVKNA